MRPLLKGQKFVAKTKPKSLLTKLVLRRAKTIAADYKPLFNLYLKTKRIEYLPDGTPYKVVAPFELSGGLGTFIHGLNQPLILVDLQVRNYKKRQSIARHEYEEWKTSLSAAKHSKASKRQYHGGDAHKRALRIEPHKKLLKEILKADEAFIIK